MENLENKLINEKEKYKKLYSDTMLDYECKQAEIKDITTMLWYVFEDYYTPKTADLYVKADNLERLQIFLSNIHSLLLTLTENMEKTVNNQFLKQKEVESEIKANEQKCSYPTDTQKSETVTI